MTEQITKIPQLSSRASDSHKGVFGRILIIGGCRGMIGAPGLAGQAALRSGAGLVRIAVPAAIQLTVAGLVPCATTIPLPEDSSCRLNHDAIPEILTAMEDNDILALGPGLSQSNELQNVIERILCHCQKPIVIDADGLNNLAACWHENIQLPKAAILTPHPGEMTRLWSAILREPIPDQRSRQAEILAQKLNAIVVLKGAGTVVTDGQKTYINNTGNPGLATGGTGDVLTGCIAGILGQSISALDAAVLATYIHGRAADLAANKLSQIALTAEDVIDFLPVAWNELSHNAS